MQFQREAGPHILDIISWHRRQLGGEVLELTAPQYEAIGFYRENAIFDMLFDSMFQCQVTIQSMMASAYKEKKGVNTGGRTIKKGKVK